MTRHRSIGFARFALALSLLAPSAGQGQTIPTGTRSLRGGIPGWTDLSSVPWVDMSDLLVAEAERRSVPDSVELLRYAAAIRFQVGHGPEAILLLVSAGAAAVNSGDPLTAANTYMDASWTAFELDRATDAVVLAEGALQIAGSGMLSRESAAALRERAVLSAGTIRVAAID